MELMELLLSGDLPWCHHPHFTSLIGTETNSKFTQASNFMGHCKVIGLGLKCGTRSVIKRPTDGRSRSTSASRPLAARDNGQKECLGAGYETGWQNPDHGWRRSVVDVAAT